jgi:hypothetical protein
MRNESKYTNAPKANRGYMARGAEVGLQIFLLLVTFISAETRSHLKPAHHISRNR